MCLLCSSWPQLCTYAGKALTCNAPSQTPSDPVSFRPLLHCPAEDYIKRAGVKAVDFPMSYPEQPFVYQAVEEYPVSGQAGLVVGSITPWVEAILLANGTMSPVGGHSAASHEDIVIYVHLPQVPIPSLSHPVQEQLACSG